MPVFRSSRRSSRIAALAAVCTAAGVLVSLGVAVAASALRPTDGYPNALHISGVDYTEWYFLPQFRLRTPEGDLFVDLFGGTAHTRLSLVPARDRGRTPEDAWLFTTYPYPEDVNPQTYAALGSPADYSLPAWASFPVIASGEHLVAASAWGWPMRCLRGVERTYAIHGPDGKITGLRSTSEGYWVCGHGGAAYSRIRRIPLGVIPAGLAVNTLLYSAAAAVVLSGGRGLLGLRARRRSRRGGCPRCGYSLVGNPRGGCPECGWGRPAEGGNAISRPCRPRSG